MAESLNAAAEHGRNTPAVTQAVSIHFHDEMDAIELEAETLRNARKKLRLRIKQTGIDLRGFDRSRKDRDRSAAEREAEDREYRRQMAWQSKPVGFQPSLDIDEAVEEGLKALNVHELHRIDTDGFEAGQTGRKRESNPWPVGMESAQRWDSAWIRGQSVIASTLSGDANGATAEPRRRGRPRKNPEPVSDDDAVGHA